MTLLAVVAPLTTDHLIVGAAVILLVLWIAKQFDERSEPPRPRRQIGQEPKPR